MNKDKIKRNIPIMLSPEENDLIERMRKIEFGTIEKIIITNGNPTRIKQTEKDILLGKQGLLFFQKYGMC